MTLRFDLSLPASSTEYLVQSFAAKPCIWVGTAIDVSTQMVLMTLPDSVSALPFSINHTVARPVNVAPGTLMFIPDHAHRLKFGLSLRTLPFLGARYPSVGQVVEGLSAAQDLVRAQNDTSLRIKQCGFVRPK